MEQSPSWNAESRWATQEILRSLYSLKVYYRVHESPPLNFPLSQMNPVHTLSPYFFKTHFNILISKPRSSKRTLAFRFPNQSFLRNYELSLASRMRIPSYSPWLRLAIIFDDVYTLGSSLLCAFLISLPPPILNILLSPSKLSNYLNVLTVFGTLVIQRQVKPSQNFNQFSSFLKQTWWRNDKHLAFPFILLVNGKDLCLK
jgi:hypothetical protein